MHAQHLYLEAMAADWVGLRSRLPAISKMACGGPDGDYARLRRIELSIGPPLLRRLQRVLAVSAETAVELVAHAFAADQIVRIPNGVDADHFAPAPDPEATRREVGFDRETVLFLGRLDPQKGLDVALRAWGRVTARRRGARLALAGEGPARSTLEAQARTLGLGDSVRFLDARPDPERLLRASRIFLLPTRSEGMSKVIEGYGMDRIVSRYAEQYATRAGGSA